MSVTLFGVLVIVTGSWLLLRGSIVAMLIFVMICSLMSGAAALAPSGLNGSTVPPAATAMPFLILRCLLPGTGTARVVGQAIRATIWLGFFALYGALTAYVLPRIFAGTIAVTPLRPIAGDNLFVTYPLAFSAQNVTVSVYLLLTAFGALCSFVALRQPGAPRLWARAVSVVALLHAGFGFASVVLAGTPLEAILKFFRNGFYAQLDQTVQGLVRMNGIAPEPSGYALYGFGYFVLATELWLRDVDPRWTRAASIALGSALLLSTSSTAYVGLAGYAMIGGLRLFIMPGGVRSGKLLALGAMAGLGAVLALLLVLRHPEAWNAVASMASRLLFEKGESLSGQQRLMWAKQGLAAFWASGGLGIGVGSFRSSSLVTAIIGSVGVIGTTAFVAHLLAVVKPLRRSTYHAPPPIEQRMGVAASWTVLVMLVPAAVTAASPDPGLSWGLTSGAALALRFGAVPASVRHAAMARAGWRRWRARAG